MAMCGVMRIEKRGRGSVYGLQIEANRTEEDHAAGRDFDRSDIDWERTRENVYLVRTDNWNREITRQIHAAGLKERKNSTVMLDGLYTASADWFASHNSDEIMQYFRDCLEFHVREYCGGDHSRVMNAVIHLDEETPHMQVASVPIIEDERGMHLSAKIICGGRQDFRLHQDHFFDQVSKSWGLERGEVRDAAEIKAHTTKREWQIATQDERFAQAKEQTRRQLKAIEHNKGVIDKQVERYEVVKDRAKEAERLVRVLDAAPNSRQIAQNARRLIFSKDLRISPSDLEKLAERADKGQEIGRMMQELRQFELKLQEKRQKVAAERAEIDRIRSSEEYKRRLDRLNSIVDRCKKAEVNCRELESTVDELEFTVSNLQEQKDELERDIGDIRDERYMRGFCRKYQREYDEYVRMERSRESRTREQGLVR